MKFEKIKTENDVVYKWCSKCNQWKNKLVDFSLKRGSNDKVHSWCKDCCVKDVADWRKRKGRWVDPLSGRIQRIISNMVKANSSLRTADIRKIYEKQNGNCYYTNVPMKLMSNIKQDPLIMSIDKKDSSGDYTKNNIVLCLYAINVMKGRHSEQILIDTLKTIYNSLRETKGWDQLNMT